MSKKRKKTRSDIILPGWESQNVVKCFLREEKASEKPCEKVGFSQIKRVSKEDIKIKTEVDEKMVLSIRESCHSYAMRKPGKKIIVLRKKKQPNENGKSEPDNKGSNNK